MKNVGEVMGNIHFIQIKQNSLRRIMKNMSTIFINFFFRMGC